MSIATLNMPRLGETMEQREIVAWLVEVGQSFRRGAAILEIETDNTVVEFPPLGDGVLAEILAFEGDMVNVGGPIARIDLGAAPEWAEADEDGPAEVSDASISVAATTQTAAPIGAPGANAERLRATPVARRLARNGCIELADVSRPTM